MYKRKIKLDQLFVASAIIVVILITIITENSWFACLCGILGLLTIFFQAKGKVIGQFIGILDSLCYGIFSYTFRFFGEFVVYTLILVPIYIYGVFSWLFHQKDTHVTHNNLSKKEWIIISILAIVFCVLFYFVMSYAKCDALVINVLSMTSLTLANYLLARRNFMGFVFLIMNDLILILLWSLTVFQCHDVFVMLICAIIYLINDIFGVISWLKIKNQEKA